MRHTVIAIALAAATVPALCAQPPQFEVASVRVNRTGDRGVVFPAIGNGTVTARNVSLKMLLRTAYDLSDLRIAGPAWLDADRYDVTAKSPQGVPDTELMPMLQALLRDRFHLAAHREMKEMAVYNMVVAKSGLKMIPFDPAHPKPPRGPAGGSLNTAAIASNGIVTMPQLAERLTASAGRPVVDKTGVEGRYGFFLFYTPLSLQAADGAPGAAAPDFFTAVEQQLGLRLESARDSIGILIVDHADRVPREN